MDRIASDELPGILLEHAGRLRHYISQRLPASMQTFVSVDDILQETWIAAFDGVDGFRADTPDAASRWLTTIARNKLADAIRAAASLKRGGTRRAVEHRSSSMATMLQRLLVDSTTPSRWVSAQQQVDALGVALCRLDEPAQTAIRLRYLDSRSHAEIAEALALTQSGVNSLLFRALRQLRELLLQLSGETRRES